MGVEFYIMNIFYLHKDPEISAKMHCDKHVVKMIIEYAQLMSTAHRILDGDEYTHRYGKIHSTDSLLRDLLSTPPKNIKEGGIDPTRMPQAMPDHCKKPDSVDAYRTYYIQEKKRFAKWTKRQVPHWFWAA